jgi:hypothetical protein
MASACAAKVNLKAKGGVSKASKTPKAKAAPKIKIQTKAASSFDAAAAEYPYMFIGAVPNAGHAVSAALHRAVVDLNDVTMEEATVGWSISADAYYALGSNPNVVDVSKAAYNHHKTARAFKASVDAETWALWVNMGAEAKAAGIEGMIAEAKRAATLRDTRRVVLQDALYFAGLAADDSGCNVLAWALRDSKLRNPMFQDFVSGGPDAIAEMRDEAARVAESIVKEHLAQEDSAGKKKKESTQDAEGAKKARRAALLMAFVDAGVEIPSEADWTAEERTFVDDGSLRPGSFMSEAEVIAAKRLLAM